MRAERIGRAKRPAHNTALGMIACKAARALRRCRDFALILPLAAGISLGAGCQKDECKSHNRTTYSIKRETDGRTAALKRIEALRGINPVAEPILDFLNETHAISTSGIPGDATITLVPERCAMTSGRHGAAYAVPFSDYLSDRGVYLVSMGSTMNVPALPIITTLSHEIGHLQSRDNGPGREVISQLNETEQYEMGFVLFLRQGAASEDLVRWLAHTNTYGLANGIGFSLTGLDDGTFAFDDADEYARSSFYIFLKLQEHDGDYAKVREETRSLSAKGKLGDALAQKTSEFAALYDGASIPDLSISVKALIFKNYLRRFGPETAEAYLRFSSMLMDSQFSVGLDGTACTQSGDMESKGYVPCDDALCQSSEDLQKIRVSARLCCIGLDPDSEELARYSISASGYRYEGTLDVAGYTWYRLFNWTSIDSKEKLGDGEPCR